MFNHKEIGLRENKPEREPAACAAWAILLPDAAEDLLSDAEQAALEQHLAVCNECSRELADARRGTAWLGLLRTHAPEPSPELLANILAKTTGAAPWGSPGAEHASGTAQRTPVSGSVAPASGTSHYPAWAGLPQAIGESVLGAHPGGWMGSGASAPALQPRLAMTVAMAFFSICVTLNLLGISVRDLHAESLRPAGLQRTVAGKSATLLRSIEGHRVVYRVESRVNHMLTASADGDQSPAAQTSR